VNGFPGPFPQEEMEAAVLDRLAAGSSVRIQVLGDRAWVYFLSRLPPATRYIAMNSGYRLVPNASTPIADALANHHAQLVAVADIPKADWIPKLESAGYRIVAVQPWPTYSASLAPSD
jgi:hypothetical protein